MEIGFLKIIHNPITETIWIVEDACGIRNEITFPQSDIPEIIKALQDVYNQTTNQNK